MSLSKRLCDDGLALPWLRSPREGRGDVLLSFLALFSLVGILGLAGSLFGGLELSSEVLTAWALPWSALLLAYSGKRMKIRVGPLSMESAGSAPGSSSPGSLDEDDEEGP